MVPLLSDAENEENDEEYESDIEYHEDDEIEEEDMDNRFSVQG